MKKLICNMLILILYSLTLHSETPNDSLFTDNNSTAKTTKKNSLVLSLFSHSSYGISENLEIDFHPLLIWISPAVGLKWKYIDNDYIVISSFHRLNYPSMLIRTLQIKGSGGMVSREFDIPDMISFENGAIMTTSFNSDLALSARIGFTFAINTFSPDKGSSIDLPVIYPAEAVFYKGYGFRLGASITSQMLYFINFTFDSDFSLYPKERSEYFLENKLMLNWKLNNNFILQTGAYLSYGKYPFGVQWHLLPIIDFRWVI